MNKNIAIIILLILFVLGCSTSTIVSPTIDISVLQTSAVETVYSEALTLNPSTKSSNQPPTLTITNTPSTTPSPDLVIVLFSENIGKNCQITKGLKDQEIRRLEDEILLEVNRLPINVSTPPPTSRYWTGIYKVQNEYPNSCFFVMLPGKDSHKNDVSFWRGIDDTLYWTYGTIITPEGSTFYSLNGIWWWTVFETENAKYTLYPYPTFPLTFTP